MEETRKLKELLERFSTAVLVTQTGGGQLRARPMAIARIEDNCDLWFITSKSSGKVDEIQARNSVNVICQDGRRLCISISGQAQVLQDQAKVEEFWAPEYAAWFPGGKSDPDICLIFVRGTEAEYWDNSGFQGVKYLFEAARAYAAGERPQVDRDVHGKVKLSTA